MPPANSDITDVKVDEVDDEDEVSGPNTSTQNLGATDDGSSALASGELAAVIVVPLLACAAGLILFFLCRRRRAGEKKGGICDELLGSFVEAKPVNVTSSTAADAHSADLESIAIEDAGAGAVPAASAAQEQEAAGEHKVVKARLRAYEVAYEARHGAKPRKRAEWGEMWPVYEKYLSLRQLAGSTKDLAKATSP